MTGNFSRRDTDRNGDSAESAFSGQGEQTLTTVNTALPDLEVSGLLDRPRLMQYIFSLLRYKNVTM